jgi:hypothetical protein
MKSHRRIPNLIESGPIVNSEENPNGKRDFQRSRVRMRDRTRNVQLVAAQRAQK